MTQAISWALSGTGFTFLMTTLGAAMVFFFKTKISDNIQRIFLGFAAGVMIAASVWSLLIPSMEEAEAAGLPGWLPAAGGFILGIAFLMLLDSVLPHLHPGMQQAEGLSTLAAQNSRGDYAAAMALALGIGIQNFPEGAAISLPLRQEGFSRRKSFLYGALSGIVEPLFGVLVVLAAGSIQPMMPWLLAFAAGAMMYVVVEELIPEAHLGEHSNIGTLGVMGGFLIMMVLDVALG